VCLSSVHLIMRLNELIRFQRKVEEIAKIVEFLIHFQFFDFLTNVKIFNECNMLINNIK